ncbi:MAG: DUF4245 domain-containing protein [Pseudonocardia sp.]|nr:DUF4245 domain-containing protein [Pseudonocardia sp.]
MSSEPDPRASTESVEPSESGEADGATPREPSEQVAAPRQRPRIGPRPLQKPARTETRMKDMLGALLILIPIVLLLVGVTRSCSFAPTGPQIDPNAGPTVDAPARLAEYARISTFPLRVPAVPWRANSTDRGPVEGGGTAVRIGYVTGDGRYLRLVQSDAGEENLLRTEAGSTVPTGEGVTPAAGLSWVTYRAQGGEPFRIATVPNPGSPAPGRLRITGSGNDDEFRTLAEATLRARPIPPGNGAN